MKFFSSLTPMQRGIAYVVMGFLILLDAVGLLSKSIHLIVFFAAFGLILYGLKLTNVLDMLMTKKK